MKVLVTGATGFIGSHVVRELLARGHQVRACARPSSNRAALADVVDSVEIATCDLWDASPGELESLGRGVELCVHAAWFAVPGQYLASPENLRCMSGSLALVRSLAHAGCPRVVAIGSCFEYDCSAGTLAESSPLDPQSLYAASKVATRFLGEQIARAEGIAFLWARLFYQYGPFEDARRLVPAVATALLRGERVDVTTGKQVRDFLHVQDVAGAIVAAALSPLTGAVNVGSGKPVTVRDVVATIESLVGRDGLVNYGGRPDNPTDPPSVCANVDRLIAATGWSPALDLRAGLADTIEWWKARARASETVR